MVAAPYPTAPRAHHGATAGRIPYARGAMKPIRPHPDHHELHGITVAVDTRGGALYVGRCHDIDAERIWLVDVDVDRDGEGGLSQRAWLEQVAKFGQWKKHDRMVLARADVLWLETLGKIAVDGPKN